MPLISVIMPAYNAGKYIAEAIDSLLEQDFKDFELLIINDGSVDDTVAIVNSRKDSRIKLIHNNTNKGIAYSRNVGLENSKGEYIAWLDSDDLAAPNRLSTQVRFLQENKNIDIVGTYANVIPEGNVLSNPTETKDIKTFLLFKNVLINSSVLARKEVYEGVRYNSAYVEDFDVWADLSWKYSFANIPLALIVYRIHSASVSQLNIESNAVKGMKVQIRQLKKILQMFDVPYKREIDILNSPDVFYLIEEMRLKMKEQYYIEKYSAVFDFRILEDVLGIFFETMINCRGTFNWPLWKGIMQSSYYCTITNRNKGKILIKCLVNYSSVYSKHSLKI